MTEMFQSTKFCQAKMLSLFNSGDCAVHVQLHMCHLWHGLSPNKKLHKRALYEVLYKHELYEKPECT